MILVDTHTHLYVEEFDNDRDQMIADAMHLGIQKFYLPNIDTSSIEPMKQLVQKYPANCFAMMGLHPCSVNENVDQELATIKKLLFAEKYVAVGEIGIDLYWDKTFVAQQKQAFRTQIKWAIELKLPISIHCRNAFDEIYAIMREFCEPNEVNALKGIFHCFSGNSEQAKKVIDLGFYLGIGGVVTFKNSGLDKVVKEIDLERIVLETDSPYLAPAPHRGKRNESGYIRIIAEKVAEIKNCSLEQVAEITTKNAQLIFGI
ncbi:MAG TPA: TatD family hydrolase [Bacteroidia bacterium]|nr:TatD family hydrolase [Bacteroidia bacterium]HRH08302.1 TatD family hydrolase [Bacteroidia bacterium]